MKNYIHKSKKSESIQKIINEALDILDGIGIPFEGKTERDLEKMAMSFLSLVDVKSIWQNAKCVEDNYGLSSKEVISYFNENFEDNISPGSYDDVPRKFIKLLLLSDFVTRSGINPKENYNSPTRKYTVPKFLRDLIINYKSDDWDKKLKEFNSKKILLREELKRKRELNMLPVILSDGEKLNFSTGTHNELQIEIIKNFLPRFGANCKVLYVGDGANKKLLKNENYLKKLNFFDISHGILPDIVAYSEEKNWLYLIEAFYSTGTISEIRMKELKKNLLECTAEIIFVTAFLTKEEFKKQILDIAWESEVWISENPDHLVHFNGHKFLGAY
ncbi:MAG: BsuBI/PstI family type II restriction endonuclease [Cyanobacteriota bacterium]